MRTMTMSVRPARFIIPARDIGRSSAVCRLYPECVQSLLENGNQLGFLSGECVRLFVRLDGQCDPLTPLVELAEMQIRIRVFAVYLRRCLVVIPDSGFRTRRTQDP